MDTPFESWGGFSTTTSDSPTIHGRLTYSPVEGIHLELVENPAGKQPIVPKDTVTLDTLYGQLVDGTLVTLYGCFITKSVIQLGIGIGAPTTVYANRAILGQHVPDLDALPVRRYSMELSSLSDWTGSKPVDLLLPPAKGASTGFDILCRQPESIDVHLPNHAVDLQISHRINTRRTAGALTVSWGAVLTLIAHDDMPFESATEIAWQCHNLLSLLIGARLSVRAVTLAPAEPAQSLAPYNRLQVLYQQVGRHDQPDVFAPLMLLPYAEVACEFPQIVDRWLARSRQAVLAANVFFGSENLGSPALNVKFLAATQAAESYHRSLGTGLYMDQAAYDTAIEQFMSRMPDAFDGDLRQSLKNRLKYGNECSLRRRLAELLGRMPENVRQAIAGDGDRFIARIVATRNYYTHYDSASEGTAYDGKEAFVATERLRVLVVANLLRDLGIGDKQLLPILNRSQEFRHWMSEPLAL